MLSKWTLDFLDEMYNKIRICVDFSLYFAKGSQKKVGRHLEWSHINSKMCSVIIEDNRTRIQPVPEHLDTLHILSHARGQES